MVCKSPFNFVPVSEKVFFPDWANNISHDIPFSDSVSGCIDLKVEAKSPIFVRNGARRAECQTTDFSQTPDNRFFLPGTSVKGMLRTVLEILSFSKMGKIDEWKPTFRDLHNQSYLNEMKKCHCGWLRHSETSESGYEIVDCGEPYFIDQRQIDKMFGSNLVDRFRSGGRSLSDREKTAEYKYVMLRREDNDSYTLADREYVFFAESQYRRCYSREPAQGPETGKTYSEISGKIVMTGQPGLRNAEEKTGKHLEFVFKNPGENPKIYPLTKEVYRNFLFAYHDGDRTSESKDWAFWKKRLDDGGTIPVFFRTDTSSVLHFGLSRLYKLPYSYGLQEAYDNLGKNHRKSDLDLAECIFGTEESTFALKGRVQVGHFSSVNDVNPLPEVCAVLGSPKASYEPFYINGKYNNGNLRLRGRKRYAVHSSQTPLKNPGTDNVSVRFHPLAAGAIFEGKIRFHNLRKCELGALLAAITLYGNSDKCYHTIGMGKPLGYGKVNVTVKSVQLSDKSELDAQDCMNDFITRVENALEINWKNEPSVKELFTLMTEQSHQNESDVLSYMDLDEYLDFKNEENNLPYYSELPGVSLFSMMTPDEWYNEIKELPENELIKKSDQFKKNEDFNKAFCRLLCEIPFSEKLNKKSKYKKFENEPGIAIKIIKNQASLKISKVDSLLKNIAGNQPEKIERPQDSIELLDYIYNKYYSEGTARKSEHFDELAKRSINSLSGLSADEVLEIIKNKDWITPEEIRSSSINEEDKELILMEIEN